MAVDKIENKTLPLLVQYHQQLDSFKQQRDLAKLQFDQLNGAIFACEQMIKQYEDNAKEAIERAKAAEVQKDQSEEQETEEPLETYVN